MRRFKLCALLVLCAAGCLDNVAPTPTPVTPADWENMAHDCAVIAAHQRAAILREGTAQSFVDEHAYLDWLNARTANIDNEAYQPIRDAHAETHKAGWSWERQREIDLKLAEGYEAVK